MVTLTARDVELVNVISSQIRGEFLRFLPENRSSFGVPVAVGQKTTFRIGLVVSAANSARYRA